MAFNAIVRYSRHYSFSLYRRAHISSILFSKEPSDPIQKLFLEKLREYKEKSAGNKMVDPTPQIKQELKSELERINKQFGGDGKADMTKFPEFKFPEVKIDPIVNE